MKYCTQCGSEIDDNAVICVKCGCSAPGAVIPSNQIYEQDSPSTGLAVLGFFLPLIGIIMFFVNKRTAPKKALSCATGVFINTIVGLVMGIVLYILFFIVFAAGLSELFDGFSGYW